MNNSIIVSGKRKRSVARATIIDGKGSVTINNRPHGILPQLHRLMIEEPLRITKEKLGKMDFDIYIKVKGGGRESQIEASRLAIARALVREPKIILADEPTGALDSITGVQILDMLYKLWKEEGKTIIMVTHDIKLANKYAHTTIELKDGQIKNYTKRN